MNAQEVKEPTILFKLKIEQRIQKKEDNTMPASFVESKMHDSGPRTQKGPIDISTIQSLDIKQFTPGKFEKRWLNVSVSALGPINVPIFALRGSAPGPTVGVIGAIHGNEVNGIPVIQQIFARLEERFQNEEGGTTISGTLIGIPVLNVPGFLDSVRSFDGHDLNRLMPG